MHEVVCGGGIPDKTMASIVNGIQIIWVHMHGSMNELIVDGERAVQSWQADKYFDNHGIRCHVRAKGQHARFIERRGALIRDTLRRMESDLKRQGIEGVPFPYILAEATFCSNALLSVNNTTPYGALYGRVPNLLPDINRTTSAVNTTERSPAEGGSSGSGDPMLPDDGSSRLDVQRGLTPLLPGSIRHAEKVREVSVASMAQQMAQDRINRANKTKTQPAAQLTFREGMTVEFYKPSGQKDLSGWTGPAVITGMDQVMRGVVKVKHKREELNVSPQDSKPYLEFLVLEYAPHVDNVSANVFTTIQHAAGKLQESTTLHLGHCPLSERSTAEGHGQWTKSTAQNQKVWNAAQELNNSFSQPTLTGARIGNGQNKDCGSEELRAIAAYHLGREEL